MLTKKALLLVLISAAGIVTLIIVMNIHQRIPPCKKFICGKEGRIGYPNPAAVYCKALGYEYENGICNFPDGTKCDAWDFLSGKCGQKWSYCEKTGGKLIVNEKCSISQTCAICILPNGKKCFEWDYCLGECS